MLLEVSWASIRLCRGKEGVARRECLAGSQGPRCVLFLDLDGGDVGLKC